MQYFLLMTLLISYSVQASQGIFGRHIQQLCDIKPNDEQEPKIYLGLGQYQYLDNIEKKHRYNVACHTLANRMESLYFDKQTCDGLNDKAVKMAPEVLKLEYDHRRCFSKNIIQNYTQSVSSFLNGESSNRNLDGHKFSLGEMKALVEPLEAGCIGHPTFTEKITCLKLGITDSIEKFFKLKKTVENWKRPWSQQKVCETFGDIPAVDVKFMSLAIANQKRTAADKDFPAWNECRGFNFENLMRKCSEKSSKPLTNNEAGCIEQALRYLGSDKEQYDRFGGQAKGYFYLLRQLDQMDQLARELDLGIHLCLERFDFVSLRVGIRSTALKDIDEKRCNLPLIKKLLSHTSFFDILKSEFAVEKKDRNWLSGANKTCSEYAMAKSFPVSSIPSDFVKMSDIVVSSGEKKTAPNAALSMKAVKHTLEKLAKAQDQAWKRKTIERKLNNKGYIESTAKYYQSIGDKKGLTPEKLEKYVDSSLSKSFEGIFDQHIRDLENKDADASVDEVGEEVQGEAVGIEQIPSEKFSFDIEAMNRQLLSELGVKVEQPTKVKPVAAEELIKRAQKANKTEFLNFLIDSEITDKKIEMTQRDYKALEKRANVIAESLNKALEKGKVDPQKKPRKAIRLIIQTLKSQMEKLKNGKPLGNLANAGGVLGLLAGGSGNDKDQNKLLASIIQKAEIDMPKGYPLALSMNNGEEKLVFYNVFMGEEFDISSGKTKKDPNKTDNIIIDTNLYYAHFLQEQDKKIPNMLKSSRLAITNPKITSSELRAAVEEKDKKNGHLPLHYLDYFDLSWKLKVPVGAIMHIKDDEKLLKLYAPGPLKSKEENKLEELLKKEGKDPALARAMILKAIDAGIPLSLLLQRPDVYGKLYDALSKLKGIDFDALGKIDLSKLGDIDLGDLKIPEGGDFDLDFEFNFSDLFAAGHSSSDGEEEEEKIRDLSDKESVMIRKINAYEDEAGNEKFILIVDRNEFLAFPDNNTPRMVAKDRDTDYILDRIRNSRSALEENTHNEKANFYYADVLQYFGTIIAVDPKLQHIIRPGTKVNEKDLPGILEKLAIENQKLVDKSAGVANVDSWLETPILDLINPSESRAEGYNERIRAVHSMLYNYHDTDFFTVRRSTLPEDIERSSTRAFKAKHSSKIPDIKRNSKKYLELIREKPEAILALMRLNMETEEEQEKYLFLLHELDSLASQETDYNEYALDMLQALNDKFKIATTEKSSDAKIQKGAKERPELQHKTAEDESKLQVEQKEISAVEEKAERNKKEESKSAQKFEDKGLDQAAQAIEEIEGRSSVVGQKGSKASPEREKVESHAASKAKKGRKKIDESRKLKETEEADRKIDSPFSLSIKEWYFYFSKLGNDIGKYRKEGPYKEMDQKVAQKLKARLLKIMRSIPSEVQEDIKAKKFCSRDHVNFREAIRDIVVIFNFEDFPPDVIYLQKAYEDGCKK